ncbi:MAG TPA: HAD hydrolase-like protein [Firmicutes bacterium]|nr:HAD hydrolase-like protein [Bacillota bacterium]
MYECTVYSGLPELLRLLYDSPTKLVVATSKPTYYAVKVLAHLKLDQYFSLIMGSNLDGTRVDKTEVISCALRKVCCPGGGRSVAMVGDRKYDILGAKANGITSVAVTYGFGSREELTAAQPDFITSSVQGLTGILLGSS